MKSQIQKATNEAEKLKSEMAKTNSAQSQKRQTNNSVGTASPPSKPFSPVETLD